ncbi:MAG TPA: zinc transporter ZupT [Candidatus Excrementavichristensenella intestinipullorum]|nr:zinc transporter ZupT [Candidatus Excrementavichristensenella intestinipullorum]
MAQANAVTALLLALIAGLCTLLGALIIFFSKGKNERLVTASLGFAAGVMLAVSFADLFPQGQDLLLAWGGHTKGALTAVAAFCGGLALAAGLDLLVPHDVPDPATGDKPHANLYRVGFISTLAIALHNFPEGIATFMAGYENMTLGLSVALAIALHNIPEGISVAMPIYYATGSRKTSLKYCFLSGIAEPVGALLAFLVLRPFISDLLLGSVFALISGIMVYIAVEELIPTSRQYGHHRLALWATLAGVVVMLLTHAI